MIVTAQRFIPIRVSVGPVTMGAGLSLDDFMRRVNAAISDISKELEAKGGVKAVGFTMTQVTVGNIDGLLIIGWAQVGD